MLSASKDRLAEFHTIVRRCAQKPIQWQSKCATAQNNKTLAMQNFFQHIVADADCSIDGIVDAFEVARNNAIRSLDAAQNDNARQHWAEVVRLCETQLYKFRKQQQEKQKQQQQQLYFRKTPSSTTTDSRLAELQQIERKLERVAELTSVVRDQVLQQMSSINSIERNVETLAVRLDASQKELEDAAPRIYNAARRNYCCWRVIAPRTTAARFRLSVAAFIIFYFVLIACGII